MGISMLSPSKPTSLQQSRIRLVLTWGTVCDLNEAVSASEALQLSLISLTEISDKSFNNFLLCDSVSLCIGKRACPVHPDMQLELGHLYYVLPIRTYQHRLTWSHISALAGMAMPSSSSAATPSSILLPSAAKTHVSLYSKSSPPSTISQQGAVSRTFSGIPDARFYLHSLLRHRLLSKWKSRVNNTHPAAPRHYCKGASVPVLALDTEGRRAEGAAEVSVKGRGSTRKFNNICESAEANCKYVELLIERSNPWNPPLQTIQESLAV